MSNEKTDPLLVLVVGIAMVIGVAVLPFAFIGKFLNYAHAEIAAAAANGSSIHQGLAWLYPQFAQTDIHKLALSVAVFTALPFVVRWTSWIVSALVVFAGAGVLLHHWDFELTPWVFINQWGIPGAAALIQAIIVVRAFPTSLRWPSVCGQAGFTITALYAWVGPAILLIVAGLTALSR